MPGSSPFSAELCSSVPALDGLLTLSPAVTHSVQRKPPGSGSLVRQQASPGVCRSMPCLPTQAWLSRMAYSPRWQAEAGMSEDLKGDLERQATQLEDRLKVTQAPYMPPPVSLFALPPPLPLLAVPHRGTPATLSTHHIFHALPVLALSPPAAPAMLQYLHLQILCLHQAARHQRSKP